MRNGVTARSGEGACRPEVEVAAARCPSGADQVRSPFPGAADPAGKPGMSPAFARRSVQCIPGNPNPGCAHARHRPHPPRADLRLRQVGPDAFAQALAARGVEILSTGGSAKALRDANIPVKEVAEHTGFPEILDGRVKTLVPQIHGGILGRRDNAGAPGANGGARHRADRSGGGQPVSVRGDGRAKARPPTIASRTSTSAARR